MRYTTPAAAVLLALSLPLLHAQEQDVLRLKIKQENAINRLDRLLEDADRLVADLRERGETHKAELLEQAVAIITSKNIEVSTVARAGGGSAEILDDLKEAMRRMKTILDERPDATEEVEALGKKVIDTFDKVIQVLTGQDEIKSLEERERTLRDMRSEARKLADRQRDLRDRTRNTTERTPAEKAAEIAAKELERLADQLRKLDAQARRELAQVDRAREAAARIEDLLRRQQRLKTETAVRAGEADELTPEVNRVLAEMEALAKAARKAEAEEAEKASRENLAREVAGLAERQQEIAREIAARDTLEAARRALESGENVAEALAKAAKAAGEPEAQVLRDAARAPGDGEARKKAERALKAALDKMASKETLARDEGAMAREIRRAMDEAPEGALRELAHAEEQAKQAKEQLEKGAEAGDAAREAADALRDAARKLGEAAAPGSDAGREEQAKAREAAAERGERLAKELSALAGRKRTQDAGLGGLAREAEEAVRRAAKEMRGAADAGRQGEANRAREESAAAAERTERAMKDLREGLRERDDLTDRQARVAEDLKALADRKSDDAGKERARGTAAKAEEAGKKLRAGDFQGAGDKQDQVIEDLGQMLEEAKAAAAAAAKQHEGALQRSKSATAKAADEANKIQKTLEQGAKRAREDDARGRMESAGERTAKAEEALRRSLRRLEDAMPKSAERERREAQDEIEKAKRDLEGLREKHEDLDDDARQRLERLGAEQKQLEEDVRRLHERVKRLDQHRANQSLDDAQSSMREAQRDLNSAEPDEAEGAQDRAEKSLKKAEQELSEEERRYRALRQYELLFKLKEELKSFRRQAQGGLEHLQQIDAIVRRDGRVSRLTRKKHLEPLRSQTKTLQQDVKEKAEAIAEENAIVYTYILNGCATDLNEVEGQLASREVGIIPQELLGDVVRRFDLAIKGLERDLEERRQDQQNPQNQQGGNGGGQPRLVPPDAEIRMVMVLQRALNEERENFFGNRPELGERKPSAGERSRIERLYHQQGSLAELFDSLRQTLVGQEEEAPFPGEEPGEGEEKEK